MSYRGAVQLLGLAIVALFAGLSGAYADTHTAASVSRSDVQTAYDACDDGDTLAIPAGSATWTTTLVVSKAIKVQGAGMDQTTITDGVDKEHSQYPDFITPFVMQIVTGAARVQLTGMTIDNGTGVHDPYNYPEIDVAGSGVYWRIDHVRMNVRRNAGLSVHATGGVIDHCEFNNYIWAVTIYGKNGGGAANGDPAFMDPNIAGTNKPFFIEDNTFTSVGPDLSVALDGWVGMRVTYRHNTNYDMHICNHGSESPGRLRSGRIMEVYNNQCNYDGADMPGSVYMEMRGGTGVIFNNTVTGNGILDAMRLTYYRDSDPFACWGPADGTGPYDLNDNSIYRQGTHTGANGIHVLTDSTANWTTNQWVGYSVRNLTQNDWMERGGQRIDLGPWFSIITENTATTLTVKLDDAFGHPMEWNNGDSYEIRRCTQAIDQCGAGACAVDLSDEEYPTPVGWVQQAIEPVYAWNNTVNGQLQNGSGKYYGVSPASPRYQSGVHYFNNAPNSPRPNYTPYTYPHPLADPSTPNIAPVITAGPTASPNPTNRGTTTTVSVTAVDPDWGPSERTYAWTKVSGPGTVTFGNSSARETTATFSATGTYVLRVTVSDSEDDTYGDVEVSVVNVAPQITAGPTATPAYLDLAGSTSVSVTATDADNQPAALSYSWTKVSGPGTVTFGSASASSSTATFSATGTYVLRVTVSDSVAQVTGDVTVDVVALSTNLVAWWKLDDGSGTSAADSSGNSNTGTFVDSPSWTTGKMVKCLSFDGSNDAVNFGNGTSLRITGAMTVAAWVYLDTDGWREIVSKDNASSYTYASWALRTVAGQQVVFQIGVGGSGTASVGSNWSVSLGQWVHVAGVYTPSTSLKIYLNGSLNNTASSGIPATQWDPANNVYIGRSSLGQSYFDGKIDDVRVYARALADNEIAALAGMRGDQAPQITSGPTCTPSPAGLTGASVSVTGNDPNNPPLTLSYGWSKVSGPGTVTFGTQAAATSTVTFSTSGTYTLRATVTNAVGSTTGDVQVTVNAAPQITAGPTCTPSPAQLTGASVSVTATDSDGPSSLTYSWSKVSGSGTVTFGSQASATSTVTFSASGTYTLRVDVYDGAAHTTGDVQVSVNAAPQITAGPTCTPTSPTLTNGSVSVTATDSDGPSGLTYSWSKVSGPGTVTFGSQTSATSTVTFSTTGTYTLRVDVYDGAAHTTGDVQIDVQSGVTGPVAWWKLDDGSGTSATDSSGNSNTGTLTNGPTWTTGKVSGALHFDGSNDYVSCGTGSSLQITGALTLAGWVYVENSNVYGEVVSKDDRVWNEGWALRVAPGPMATFQIATSSSSIVTVSTPNGFSGGQWVHLAGVYDPSATSMKIYVDGSLANTYSSAPGSQYNNSGTGVYVGRTADGTSWMYFPGKLDDVRVYSRALSLSEIQDLANPSSNQAPQITAGPTASPSTVDLPIKTTLSVTATDSDGPSGLTYEWTKVSGPGNVTFGTSTASTTTARFDATGTYSLQIDVYDGASHTTSTVQVTVSTSNMAAYWKLDETSGTSAADCSGNSNSGTFVSSPTWTTGKVNGALHFDGSDDGVSCGTGSSLQITGAMTVAAWVYVENSNVYGEVVSKDDRVWNEGWALRVAPGPMATFQIATSSSSTVSVNTPNGFSGGQWVHLAGVYDPSATSMKIYVNGSLANTYSSAPGSQYNNSGTGVYVGRTADGTSWMHFPGKIDEAVVYSRALSLSEIQALAAQP